MNEHERQSVVNQLESSWRHVVGLVEGLTPEQWKFHPAEGRWAINECLEHLTHVENRVFGAIGKRLSEGVPEPEKRAAAKAKEVTVMEAVSDRSTSRQAPEPALPTGHWSDGVELLSAFSDARRRTVDFAATAKADLRSYFHPHGAFGELDCYQWLTLLAAHVLRHSKQIEEIKATPGFPS